MLKVFYANYDTLRTIMQWLELLVLLYEFCWRMYNEHKMEHHTVDYANMMFYHSLVWSIYFAQSCAISIIYNISVGLFFLNTILVLVFAYRAKSWKREIKIRTETEQNIQSQTSKKS